MTYQSEFSGLLKSNNTRAQKLDMATQLLLKYGHSDNAYACERAYALCRGFTVPLLLWALEIKEKDDAAYRTNKKPVPEEVMQKLLLRSRGKLELKEEKEKDIEESPPKKKPSPRKNRNPMPKDRCAGEYIKAEPTHVRATLTLKVLSLVLLAQYITDVGEALSVFMERVDEAGLSADAGLDIIQEIVNTICKEL
jgi:hypothetical protein